MSKFSIEKFTKRNQFTRMCIGDAVIELMNEKPFDKIKVSDITRKAGVSRMTFYKYYGSKEEVVEDYLNEIVTGYMNENRESFSEDYPNYESTLHALEYFDQYSKFFLGMARGGLYSLLIEYVNRYVENRVVPYYKVSSYKVYYYAGAILNIFIKWEEKGKDKTKEAIADEIASINIQW